MMLRHIVAPLRQVIHALVAGDSPRQLAAGFTLGMMIGIVPKGNLIAISLCVLLFSLRVNKGLGLAAAVLFTWLGGYLDPFSARLGTCALGTGPLEATCASVYNLPLGPWWKLNNTAVTGSLLVGLYLVYPVYWTSHAAGKRLQPRAVSLLGRWRVTRWLFDMPATTPKEAAP